MNILDFVLNWILNWIIFRPDSMKKWIFKTYRPGLGASHNHVSSQSVLKFDIVRPIDISVHMGAKTVGKSYTWLTFFSSGVQIEYKKGDMDKRNTLVRWHVLRAEAPTANFFLRNSE